MKKKFPAILLIAMMLISLTACKAAGPADNPKNTGEERDSTPQTVAETAAQATSEPSAETTGPEAQEETAPTEETISDIDIFLQFLNGKTDAYLESDPQYSLQYVCTVLDYDTWETSYTFADSGTLSFSRLKSAVAEGSYAEGSDTDISYAIFSTVAGKKVLAVRFLGVGIDGPGDDSYALFLFAVNNGQLTMTDAYDSWSRSRVQICNNLILPGQGSAGAGDGFDWCNYVDETGHLKIVYELEILSADWVAMYDWEDFGMDTQWSQGSTFYLLETADGHYFSYEADDSVDPAKLQIFIKHLEDAGMQEVSDIRDLIDIAFANSGIVREQISPFDNWIPLN